VKLIINIILTIIIIIGIKQLKPFLICENIIMENRKVTQNIIIYRLVKERFSIKEIQNNFKNVK